MSFAFLLMGLEFDKDTKIFIAKRVYQFGFFYIITYI